MSNISTPSGDTLAFISLAVSSAPVDNSAGMKVKADALMWLVRILESEGVQGQPTDDSLEG